MKRKRRKLKLKASESAKQEAGGQETPRTGRQESYILHLRRPMPLARAIRWSPVVPESGQVDPDDESSYDIFISQAALRDIQEHVWETDAKAHWGFLLGVLLECPKTQRRYTVIESVLRGSSFFEEANQAAIMATAWSAMERERSRVGAELLGWYHSHPHLGVVVSEADAQTQMARFDSPWHCMLIMTQAGSDPAAGFFRSSSRGTLSRRQPVAFYELVEPDSVRGDAKRSYMRWSNYRTDEALAVEDQERPAEPPPVESPPQPDEASAADIRHWPQREADAVGATVEPDTTHVEPDTTHVEPEVDEPEAEEPEPIAAEVADLEPTAESEPEAAAPEPEPEPEEPQPEAEEHEPEVEEPEPEAEEPEPIAAEAADLEPPAESEPEAAAPEPEAAESEPEAAAPEPEAAAPEPEVIAPATKPETDEPGPASEPEVERPEPGWRPAARIAAAEKRPTTVGIDAGRESRKVVKRPHSRVETPDLVLPTEVDSTLVPFARRANGGLIGALAALGVLFVVVYLMNWTSEADGDQPEAVVPIPTVNPTVERFNAHLRSLDVAIVSYGERKVDFDLGRINCDGLGRGYRAVDDTFVATSQDFVASRAMLTLRQKQEYESLLLRMDDVNEHFDDSGCPRPD